MHKILNELEIRTDATTDFYWLQCGKRRHHALSNVFDRIHFILAGNDDIQDVQKAITLLINQYSFFITFLTGMYLT